MVTKAECDKYAAELAQRFEEFTKWAIANWPNKSLPLLPSDFSQSRREIGQIIGPKLGEGEDSPMPSGKDSPQYIDITPMPWP